MSAMSVFPATIDRWSCIFRSGGRDFNLLLNLFAYDRGDGDLTYLALGSD